MNGIDSFAALLAVDDSWIELILRSSLILLVALAFVRFQRRGRAGTRSAVLAGTGLLLVAVVALSVPGMDVVRLNVPVPLPVSPVAPETAETAELDAAATPSAGEAAPAAPSSGDEQRPPVPGAPAEPGRLGAVASPAPPASAVESLAPRLVGAVPLLLVSVSLFLLGRLVWALHHVKALGHRASPAPPWMGNRLSTLARDLGSAPPALRVSAEVRVPMTCGLLSPLIVLPPEAERWDGERLDVVLLHELGHVTRRDWAARLVMRVARALYWWHPLALWASRRLELEQEMACDEWVVERCRPSRYADHLLSLHDDLLHSRAGLPAVALPMLDERQLERRMMNLLDPLATRRSPARLAAVAAVVLLVGVAAVRPTVVRRSVLPVETVAPPAEAAPVAHQRAVPRVLPVESAPRPSAPALRPRPAHAPEPEPPVPGALPRTPAPLVSSLPPSLPSSLPSPVSPVVGFARPAAPAPLARISPAPGTVPEPFAAPAPVPAPPVEISTLSEEEQQRLEELQQQMLELQERLAGVRHDQALAAEAVRHRHREARVEAERLRHELQRRAELERSKARRLVEERSRSLEVEARQASLEQRGRAEELALEMRRLAEEADERRWRGGEPSEAGQYRRQDDELAQRRIEELRLAMEEAERDRQEALARAQERLQREREQVQSALERQQAMAQREQQQREEALRERMETSRRAMEERQREAEAERARLEARRREAEVERRDLLERLRHSPPAPSPLLPAETSGARVELGERVEAVIRQEATPLGLGPELIETAVASVVDALGLRTHVDGDHRETWVVGSPAQVRDRLRSAWSSPLERDAGTERARRIEEAIGRLAYELLEVDLR